MSSAIQSVSTVCVKKVITYIMSRYPTIVIRLSFKCEPCAKRASFKYIDRYTGRAYIPNHNECCEAFNLMLHPNWLKLGFTKPPRDTSDEAAWDKWIQRSDDYDYDAFIQLIFFHEIRYTEWTNIPTNPYPPDATINWDKHFPHSTALKSFPKPAVVESTLDFPVHGIPK